MKNIDNSIFVHNGNGQTVQPTDAISAKASQAYIRDENFDRFRIAFEHFASSTNVNGTLFYSQSRTTQLQCASCNVGAAWPAGVPALGSVVRGLTTSARYVVTSLGTAGALETDWVTGQAVPGEGIMNEKAIFKASINNNVMTVTAMLQGPTNIALGQRVVGMYFNNGITANTNITAVSPTVACNGIACTGTGGVGTYALNNSQTILQTEMTSGNVSSATIGGGGVNNTDTTSFPIQIGLDSQVYFRSVFLARSRTAYNNGAAAATATLTNAPAAGNPTKWIPVDDNGTTRFIPAW